MQEISQMKLSGSEEVLAERLQSFNKEKNFVIRELWTAHNFLVDKMLPNKKKK